MIELDLTSMRWRKSSRSAQGGDACVEVAGLSEVIAVRDSKNPTGPALAFDAATFGAFIATVCSSGHDL